MVMLFVGWILQEEYVFEDEDYSDLKCVLLTDTKLEKGAMHWWRNFHQQWVRQGLPKITRWSDMKAVEHRYIPLHYQQDLSERVASLTHGSFVTDYSDEFHTLNSRVDIAELDHIIVGRYRKPL